MRGASGAKLRQQGDLVQKSCVDALEQVRWFADARKFGFVDGVSAVEIYWHSVRTYTMNHIIGHVATHEPQTVYLTRIYDQVRYWRDLYPMNFATWSSYIDRLYEHAETTTSHVIYQAVEMVAAEPEFEQSFCHGDLTLENIIIDQDGTAWLIDPNSNGSLFQSWVLDCGKLLQSTHTDYHRLFNSHPGVHLRKHDAVLRDLMVRDGVYRPALTACLSHIIRLCKYRKNDIDKVEQLAIPLMMELEC
jgi:hypothetical protein